MSGKKKGNKGNAVWLVLREKLFERKKMSLGAIGDTSVGGVERKTRKNMGDRNGVWGLSPESEPTDLI